jgi:hypothetical protein
MARRSDTSLPRARAVAATGAAGGRRSEPIKIPILVEGADPGRVMPSPFAIRDTLRVDPELVQDHDPSRLFAYEVTMREMRYLRGFAAPGDRIVFRRGGPVGGDRVCAVRTPWGMVLSRVRFRGRSLFLLPGEGRRGVDAVGVEDLTALRGVIAGTHILLIQR